MKAKVILNPYSGRWTGLKRRPDVEEALRMAGIQYELEVTEGPGHGIELAEKAVHQGFDPIISAGGDGSISEVMNGMARATLSNGLPLRPALGILPLGTANDLVVNLRLPNDLPGAARVISAGKTRWMDLGLVIYQKSGNGSPTAGSHYFDNNSAVGLEPTVTLIQQGITRIQGVLRYLVATLIAISRNPQWNMRLEWEGGEYHGPVTLVTIGNHPLTGGLFYMTPHADPFDGKLTFVYGYIRHRLQILGILPKTMKPGKGSYVEHPAIHEVHSPWLRITSDQPTPLHADGEIQSEQVQHIEYRILPGAIRVLVQ